MLIKNKKAKFEYEILDKFEAGVVLSGPEVKAIRAGKASIVDSYVKIRNGELYITGLDITKYEQIGYTEHDALRDKKILLHKREILKISSKITEKGLSLIPLSIYVKGKYIKLELALVKGKKLHDRRDDLKRKAEERSMERKYKIR